jgi:hypothetical protein
MSSHVCSTILVTWTGMHLQSGKTIPAADVTCPLSNPNTAGVLTVVRIIAGNLNHSGAGRGVATSLSSTQCHPCKIQLLSGSPSTASSGG